MGWGKDMLFLGGYLSPAVLAEEIELERAVEAAAAARHGAQAPAVANAAVKATATAAPAPRVAHAVAAPLRPRA